jgi:hypothetical protein
MFALANVLHLLSHEFAGLRRRRFALPFISLGSFDSFLLGHDLVSSSLGHF